jgi:hypothetical protein
MEQKNSLLKSWKSLGLIQINQYLIYTKSEFNLFYLNNYFYFLRNIYIYVNFINKLIINY